MRSYSREIAATVLGHMDDFGWHYSWNEENGIAQYSVELKGNLHRARAFLRVNDDCFLTFTIFPLSARTSDRQEMLNTGEFLTRVNYGLTCGNFLFDFDSGSIQYKMTIDCDGALPSQDMVVDALMTPMDMLNRYGPGISRVMLGMQSPEEAVKECRQSRDNALNLLHTMEEDPDTFLAAFRAFCQETREQNGESGAAGDEEEEYDDEELLRRFRALLESLAEDSEGLPAFGEDEDDS